MDPEQALRILLAANVGKLALILRQPEEVALAPDARITDRDLFGGDDAQAPAPTNPSLPAVQAQPVALQPDPPPAASPPPETTTRKITVVRSVRSEQYEVPEEVQ